MVYKTMLEHQNVHRIRMDNDFKEKGCEPISPGGCKRVSNVRYEIY